MHEFLSHSPAAFISLIFVISILAGVLGALLGIGGGMLITPVLTLLLGINIRYAIGVSIVAVIATSSGAAAIFVRDRLANIRVAMILEVGTVIGAIAGAALTPFISVRILYGIFALLLMYSAYSMFQKRNSEKTLTTTNHPWAQRLRLHSTYPEQGKEVAYGVQAVPYAMFLMLGAGLISALLGLGSGILKVPAMDSAMGLPIKVSSATSNFMIGVTAAASAGTYYMRGVILPILTAPSALGVIVGSAIGSHLMMKLPSAAIRKYFVVFIVIVAIQMALRALGIVGQS